MSNGPRSNNLHCQEMTAALEANPPEIVWEPNGHGVMVAISVKDPHGEQRKRGRQKKATAPKARPITAAAYKAALAAHALQLEEAQRRVLETLQTEAEVVAERFRTHRANNTPLLNSARRAI